MIQSQVPIDFRWHGTHKNKKRKTYVTNQPSVVKLIFFANNLFLNELIKVAPNQEQFKIQDDLEKLNKD